MLVLLYAFMLMTVGDGHRTKRRKH
jgi:hypothetical protein